MKKGNAFCQGVSPSNSGAFILRTPMAHTLSMRFMSKVVGEWIAGIGPNLTENLNLNVMKYIESFQGEINFKTIATRPGGLKTGVEEPSSLPAIIRHWGSQPLKI